MAFNWIVATVCYYGLTLNSVGIGSSVFTSFSLSSAMEIPAYIFSAMVNDFIFFINYCFLSVSKKFPGSRKFNLKNFRQQKFDAQKASLTLFWNFLLVQASSFNNQSDVFKSIYVVFLVYTYLWGILKPSVYGNKCGNKIRVVHNSQMIFVC